jgi:hypothetical protein
MFASVVLRLGKRSPDVQSFLHFDLDAERVHFTSSWRKQQVFAACSHRRRADVIWMQLWRSGKQFLSNEFLPISAFIFR